LPTAFDIALPRVARAVAWVLASSPEPLRGADAIAAVARGEGDVVTADGIVPSVLNHGLVGAVAEAVAAAAEATGVARVTAAA